MSTLLVGGSEVKAGDRLVYPNGGLVRVKGVETTVIGGKPWVMLVLTREEDGAVIRVMPEKLATVGLRKVADRAAIELLFDFLSRSIAGPELDWKVRHKENFERMSAGGLLEHAEILKGLHALAKVRPLPTKERELYNHVRHLLITEIAASWGVPLAVAENNIDYALNPPPGSGREAPSDEPLDVKKLRRMLGGTRKSVAGGDEFGLGEDAEELEEADEESEEEGATEEGGEQTEGGESGDDSDAKPAKAEKKPAKADKKAAPKKAETAKSAKKADAPKPAAPVDEPKVAKKAEEPKPAKKAAAKPAEAPAPAKPAKAAKPEKKVEKKAAKPAADEKKSAAKKPAKAEKAAPAKKAAKGGKS